MSQISQIRHNSRKYAFSLFFLLFFLIGRPIEFGEEKGFFHGYALAKPIIRVALGRQLKEALIRASSGMKIYEVSDKYNLIASEATEILLRTSQIQLSEKFLIQVAMADSRRQAEKISQSMAAKLAGRIIIAEEVDRYRGRKIYTVRYGDFLTRGEALSFLKRLNEAGFTEAWIVREEIAKLEKEAFWALVDNHLFSFKEKTTLYLIPANPWSFLSYNGSAFRGMFVVQMKSTGLQLVNVLNLEDYLKGVVPMELSPDRFKELEALKAQAVAARTYAFRNLGLMASQGFDLLATPDHQAYGGLTAEHPLSNQAVVETKGEGLLFRGKPINALYTSTCGGMTEDGQAIFGGADLPYLKAIECVDEKRMDYQLNTARSALHFSLGARDLTAEVTFLVSLGILEEEKLFESPGTYLSEAAIAPEIETWLSGLEEFFKIKFPKSNPSAEPITLAAFSRLVIDYLGWSERMQHLLFPSEINFLLRNFPSGQEKDRRAIAYLIREGYLSLPPVLDSINRPITRGEALLTLAKILIKEKNLLRKGQFRALENQNLKVEVDGEIKNLKLSPQVFLFRLGEGGAWPATQLTLLGGEEIFFLERGEEVVWLKVGNHPETNVLDRSSAFSSWQVRLSREELSRRLNEYFPIGELKDIKVLRRGKSHRVLELQITGQNEVIIVRGLRIRWVLGLRDTLFSIDREYDSQGRISHFVFTGRGWGHGVGLCQVGAFGLAQRGANYRQILNKYYPGTKIGRLY
ncbi:MAG: SpoIID/LytB domain-containing protein [Candidatus Aminicenantes bacterium]|nr:SpoIID/LytB domain-containing protein [Candidatus Aminicenantes bacterium]